VEGGECCFAYIEICRFGPDRLENIQTREIAASCRPRAERQGGSETGDSCTPASADQLSTELFSIVLPLLPSAPPSCWWPCRNRLTPMYYSCIHCLILACFRSSLCPFSSFFLCVCLSCLSTFFLSLSPIHLCFCTYLMYGMCMHAFTVECTAFSSHFATVTLLSN